MNVAGSYGVEGNYGGYGAEKARTEESAKERAKTEQSKDDAQQTDWQRILQAELDEIKKNEDEEDKGRKEELAIQLAKQLENKEDDEIDTKRNLPFRVRKEAYKEVLKKLTSGELYG